MANLLGRSKIVPAIVPTAGSVAAITAVEVDGTGFDRACFILATGAAGTSATLSGKIQKAAATGMGTPADVTGAAIVNLAAATGASKVYGIDLQIDPAKPFMIWVGAVGTQTFANGAVCVLYEGSGTYPKVAATEAVIVS
jgi:hypothetical protein